MPRTCRCRHSSSRRSCRTALPGCTDLRWSVAAWGNLLPRRPVLHRIRRNRQNRRRLHPCHRDRRCPLLPRRPLDLATCRSPNTPTACACRSTDATGTAATAASTCPCARRSAARGAARSASGCRRSRSRAWGSAAGGAAAGTAAVAPAATGRACASGGAGCAIRWHRNRLVTSAAKRRGAEQQGTEPEESRLFHGGTSRRPVVVPDRPTNGSWPFCVGHAPTPPTQRRLRRRVGDAQVVLRTVEKRQ